MTHYECEECGAILSVEEMNYGHTCLGRDKEEEEDIEEEDEELVIYEQLEESVDLNHNHYWKCTDIPGYFLCECGVISRYNRETKSKEILVPELKGGEI